MLKSFCEHLNSKNMTSIQKCFKIIITYLSKLLHGFVSESSSQDRSVPFADTKQVRLVLGTCLEKTLWEIKDNSASSHVFILFGLNFKFKGQEASRCFCFGCQKDPFERCCIHELCQCFNGKKMGKTVPSSHANNPYYLATI